MAENLYLDAPAEALLTKMRLPKQVLCDLATKVGGERANVAPTEPPAVIGYETWRWGTRYGRDDIALANLDWVSCDEDQVHGIRNDAVGIKLVVLATDENTGTSKRPRNLRKKGPANCKLIQRNSGQIEMFPSEAKATKPKHELWYLCLHYGDRFIGIEVSRPDGETAGMITHYSDRVVVARPGDLPFQKIHIPEDFAEVAKPEVTRIGS